MNLNLEHLESLMAKWKRLQLMLASREEKFWLKMRFEWNYNSNHLEGNTLTYGETELLLLHDQTSGTHTSREYSEMKGHDLAIALIRDMARHTQELTEADVRNLNQILLKESFYKEAITATGEATRKEITPGQYKQSPNSVRTSTGEMFNYAEPLDVPPRMAKLVQSLRSSVDKEGLTFLAALAITHHEFTLIHPFDDGNGRVARLLTNYVLLKKGLPPMVIPSMQKDTYLAALRLADTGDASALTEFFSEKLRWSLELGIKAAEGESIEEPSDIEKEIALFVKEQKSQKKEVVKKDANVVHQFLVTSAEMLIEKFDQKTTIIGELFETREMALSVDTRFDGITWQERLSSIKFQNIKGNVPRHIILNLTLKGYLGKASHPFGLSQVIMIILEEYEYRISSYGQQMYHSVYTEELTSKVADEIVSNFLKQLLEQIKQLSQQ